MQGLTEQEYINFQNLKQLVDNTLTNNELYLFCDIKDTKKVFDEWINISGELIDWGFDSQDNYETSKNMIIFAKEKASELKKLMDKAVNPLDKYSIYKIIFNLLDFGESDSNALDFRDDCRENGLFQKIAKGLIKINKENLDILNEMAEYEL